MHYRGQFCEARTCIGNRKEIGHRRDVIHERAFVEAGAEAVHIDLILQNVEALTRLDLAVVLQRTMTTQEEGEIATARADLENRTKLCVNPTQLLIQSKCR